MCVCALDQMILTTTNAFHFNIFYGRHHAIQQNHLYFRICYCRRQWFINWFINFADTGPRRHLIILTRHSPRLSLQPCCRDDSLLSAIPHQNHQLLNLITPFCLVFPENFSVFLSALTRPSESAPSHLEMKKARISGNVIQAPIQLAYHIEMRSRT